MKIVDSFIFYNELDLLEFRLELLNDIVDKFVLVESTKTFVGNNKQLFFQENKDRYKKYLEKIVHVIVDDMNDSNPWNNETTQRNGIQKGLSQIKLVNEDLIIISDADEIIDPKTLSSLKKNNSVQSIMNLVQDLYYYNITCKFEGSWKMSKIMNYKTYKTKPAPQDIRLTAGIDVPNGGWHFSYFGDVNFIKNKIMNFSHQEFNNKIYYNKKHLLDKIQNGHDLFNRQGQNINFKLIDPEDNDYLPEGYEKLLKFKQI